MVFLLMSYQSIAMAVDENLLLMFKSFSQAQNQIYGESFTYLEGKGEMRLYKVDVQPAGVAPFHFHEARLFSDIEEGQLTLKTTQGKSTTFLERDSFVL